MNGTHKRMGHTNPLAQLSLSLRSVGRGFTCRVRASRGWNGSNRGVRSRLRSARTRDKRRKTTNTGILPTSVSAPSIRPMSIRWRLMSDSFPVPLHYGNGHIPTRRVMFVLMYGLPRPHGMVGRRRRRKSMTSRPMSSAPRKRCGMRFIIIIIITCTLRFPWCLLMP